MNRRMNFQHLGGLFLTQDSLEYLQGGFSGALDALAKAVGDKVILTGVADQGTTTGEGWIAFNGEALPFVGGLKASYILVEEIVQDEQYDDNQQRPVYHTRRLKYGNVAPANSTLGFAASELTRMPFNTDNVKSALNAIQSMFKAVVNLEAEVIIEGCLVDDSIPGSVAISEGLILFNGRLIASPAYVGVYPAYISEAGTWSTEVPAGLYVVFNPHTSQHYKDVLYRQNRRTGEIIYSKVLSNRFDANTGIGRWEWHGFRLSEEDRGRVAVGYWFSANGAPNHYENIYRTVGETGGENRHKLIQSELPAYQMESEIIGDNGWPDDSARRGGPDQYLLSPLAANKNPRRLKMNSMGGDAAHENRQPFIVRVAIERM